MKGVFQTFDGDLEFFLVFALFRNSHRCVESLLEIEDLTSRIVNGCLVEHFIELVVLSKDGYLQSIFDYSHLRRIPDQETSTSLDAVFKTYFDSVSRWETCSDDTGRKASEFRRDGVRDRCDNDQVSGVLIDDAEHIDGLENLHLNWITGSG